MRLKRFVALCFIALLSFCLAPIAHAQEPSERPPDETILVGDLKNGVRYVIVARRSEAFADATSVAVRMRVDGGWSAEREGERGLAHLLEHMPREANGEMSAQEVIAFRDQQTIVREWGAFTSPYASEYFLTTRTNTQSAIAQALSYFRGAATGLRLTEDLVGRQRQIIANEMAPRIAQARRLYKRAQFLAPESEWDLSKGYDSSDVETASIATIRDLHARLYQPQNITIVLAGNIDPDAALSLVSEAFGTLTGSQEQKVADDGKGADLPESVPDISVDHEGYGDPLVLASLQSRATVLSSHEVDSSAARQADMLDRMIALILSHRLDLHSLENGFSGAEFTLDNTAHDRRSLVWQLAAADGQWHTPLALLLDQIAAVKATGFTAREVHVAKKILLRETREAHAQYVRFSNMRISSQISEAITKGYALWPETERFAHDSTFLEGVTQESLNRTLKQIVANKPIKVRLEGVKEQPDAPLLLEPAIARYLQSYTPRNVPVFDTRAGAPEVSTGSGLSEDVKAAIVQDTRSETGVRSLTFRNGSTLRLIKRPHDGAYLEMAAYINAPSARRTLSHCDGLVLPSFVTAGGSLEQSDASRRDAMWGTQVRYFPIEITPTGLRTGASMRKEYAQRTLISLHRLIARPAFRESAQSVAQARSESVVRDAKLDLIKSVVWALDRHLTSDTSLQTEIAKGFDCNNAVEMARADRLLGPILTAGSIDFAIAGNMDEEQMIALFAATFGKDNRDHKVKPEATTVADDTAFANHYITLDFPPDANDQGTVAHIWAMAPPTNGQERARQELLTALLARMVYIELVEQGSNYAPRVERVELMASGQPPVLVTAAKVQLGEARAVSAAIEKVTKQLTECGPTPELMDAIRGMVIDGISGSYHQDRAWAYQAAQLSTRPDLIRIWRDIATELITVSADDVQSLAQQTFARPVAGTDKIETQNLAIGTD